MKQIICKDCGKSFSISPEKEKFYISKGLQDPKRCKKCREIRKEQENRIKAEQDEKELQRIATLFENKPIEFTSPDKSLVIIGNGFDIMHGVKSSYWEFQKTIGKNNPLRWEMETYLDTGDLWSNLEDSLGRLNYSMFLNPYVIDMWLDVYGSYDPDCQAADFTAAVEEAIAPTFNIPKELNSRFKKWLKTLKVESDDRPLSMLHGEYKVLSFNYTEFIETLYGAKRENICYIHGCRKTEKGKKYIALLTDIGQISVDDVCKRRDGLMEDSAVYTRLLFQPAQKHIQGHRIKSRAKNISSSPMMSWIKCCLII